jgi:alpha-1,2-mannosyltransferase
MHQRMAAARPSWLLLGALVLWLGFASFIGAIQLWPRRPPVGMTVPEVYSHASACWFGGQPLYTQKTIHGFLYLPTFAVLYGPAILLPAAASEVIWRTLGLAMLAHALWRLCLLAGSAAPRLFLMVTILMLFVAHGAARLGQVNVHLSAVMVYAALAMAEQRWRALALWLCLAVVLKPVMLPMLLLGGVVRPKEMGWRLGLGLAGVLLLPFAFQAPAYVAAQYHGFATKMFLASDPAAIPYGFADIFALTRLFGWHFPRAVEVVVQASAGLATAGLCRLAVRRWDPVPAALFFLAISGSYVLLFNPRTETNGYVLVGTAVAFLAAVALMVEDRRVEGIVLVLIQMGLALGWNFTRGQNQPLSAGLCVLFVGLIVHRLLADQPPVIAEPALPPAPAEATPGAVRAS